MDIAEPCWLYVGRITDLDDTGQSWRFAYRSVLLRDDDPMCRRAAIDSAEVINTETVDDPRMMFGQAVLAICGPTVWSGSGE